MAARVAAEKPEQPPRLSCSRSGFWARQLQSGPDRTVRTSPTHLARPTARLRPDYLRTSSDSGSASRLRRRSWLQRQTTLCSAEGETTEPDRSRSTSWSRLQNQNQEPHS